MLSDGEVAAPGKLTAFFFLIQRTKRQGYCVEINKATGLVYTNKKADLANIGRRNLYLGAVFRMLTSGQKAGRKLPLTFSVLTQQSHSEKKRGLLSLWALSQEGFATPMGLGHWDL